MSLTFVSIDLETTGLDPQQDQILAFAAVAVRNGKVTGSFERYLRRDRVSGSPAAMAMNAEVLRVIAQSEKVIRNDCGIYVVDDTWLIDPEDLEFQFWSWLTTDELGYSRMSPLTIQATGKNFGSFDLQFLKAAGWGRWVRFRHRVLDPGTLYYDPRIDEELPNLKECLQRSDLDEKIYTEHDAYSDAAAAALLVIEYYRRQDGVSSSNEAVSAPTDRESTRV